MKHSYGSGPGCVAGWMRAGNICSSKGCCHKPQENGWLADQDPSYLLRGTRLDQFEQWAETTDLALSDMERLFLDDALHQRSVRQAEEAARLQREKRLERRSRNFLQALASILALATVIALLLVLYAFGQQREALEAYSLSLIANAKQAIDDRDTATALVLALAANDIADPPLEAQRTLLDAAYAPGARQRYEISSLFPDLTGPVTTLVMSPDGRQGGDRLRRRHNRPLGLGSGNGTRPSDGS